MIAFSKLLNILEILYETLFKSSICYLFKLYYNNSKKYQIQASNDIILTKSASTLAKEIIERKIKSETIVKAYIKRIKQIQPVLNCVVDERFDDAIKEAQEVDRLLASNSKHDNLPPLLGIPFTCCESICVKGRKNSAGLVCRKNIIAEQDAQVIKLMKKAGAILLCITNVSELGLWCEASNHIYGRTNNPYDTRRIVGSSGDGCIISGMGGLIGVSSDLSGGLRLSAYFNGIYAHKPTYGLVSNIGHFPSIKSDNQNIMFTIGPICRFSEDINLILDVLIADNNNNIKLIDYGNTLDLKNLKFFFIDTIDALFVSKLSNDVKLALNNFTKFIETHTGNEVKRINSKHLSKACYLWYSMISKSDDPYQLNKLITDNKGINSLFLEIIHTFTGASEHTLPISTLSVVENLFAAFDFKERYRYLDLIDQLKEELNSLLGVNGVLIFPSYPTPAPFHNQTVWTNPFDSFVYNGLFNILGFPSTQVCLGLNADKLPIGVQLVSNHYCDKLTIRLANIIEDEYNGWCEP